jgi:hypothetical protein
MPHGYRRGNRAFIYVQRAELPYAADLDCQRFVEEHPDGATLEEVGAFFGVTRERARQLEFRALHRLRLACAVEGVTVEDVLRVWGVDGEGDYALRYP